MVSAQIPALQSAVNSSGVALGIIAQPFAELSCDEKDVPLVNYGESGPMRCPRCKSATRLKSGPLWRSWLWWLSGRAYANPAFQWIGGGEECICNFCNYVMEVPQVCVVMSIDLGWYQHDLRSVFTDNSVWRLTTQFRKPWFIQQPRFAEISPRENMQM